METGDLSHTLLIRKYLPLYEEFERAASGWNLDFKQLGPAHGSFFLEQVLGRDALASRAVMPSRFLQRGSTTPGYRTVSILMSPDHVEAWRWCGETVTRSSLLVMPVGGEFESVSTPHFDSAHLALRIEKLQQVAQEQFDKPLHHLMPEGRCFCPHGGPPLVALRQLLTKIVPGTAAQLSPLQFSDQLETELAYLVLACLEQNGSATPCGVRGKRGRALEKALRVVGSEPALALSVPQLAVEVGVSRRTLENAFRDGLGVSPSAYLKALRLGRLSRALSRPQSTEVKVAELAALAGFQHLGQMAADYRAMFGELPSQTLRRATH